MLSPIEASILRLRTGLNEAEQELTLKEIGERYDLSRRESGSCRSRPCGSYGVNLNAAVSGRRTQVTEVVDTLEGPPELGRVYLVPCVYIDPAAHVGYAGLLKGWWPVIGPRHEDAEIVGFEPMHWHFDYRFLSDTQYRNRSKHQLERLFSRNSCCFCP
ncbi:sigma factor-like helix-turn-helix DNA-binding protein [Nannocystis pusilla]|uniref:sigma factor-like helix-turn-helix DNA-binding protein n=1 Tax=Nannocystis pusilla TaxID=889268 RepID=UPI003B7FFBB9